MGRHERASSLVCAVMQAILDADPDSPATTDEIIDATGRWALRVCWVLTRLENRGWVQSEKTGQDRVWYPSFAACWYEAKINAASAGEGKTGG
jgi:predicted transcriptional regulator